MGRGCAVEGGEGEGRLIQRRTSPQQRQGLAHRGAQAQVGRRQHRDIGHRIAGQLVAHLVAERDALKAAMDKDSELLTIAYMDGSHRSTQAHRETIKRLTAERDAAREELAKR